MRRVVLAFALVGAWYWWHRSPEATQQEDAWQGAVLDDGFAVRYGDRVQELDFTGARRANHEVPDDRSVRVFGSNVGASAAWIKNGQLQLFDLRKREVVAAYGTAATTLCDGVGTNDARFVVGWREQDGDLWFLHGPTRAPAASSMTTELVAHAEEPWCAVASAEHLIALAWRDRDRLRINWCTTKYCSALPAAVKLAPSIAVIGMGCLRNACVVATRESSDAVELKYVTESGSVKWRFRLATNVHTLAILGIADRAFAVAVPGHVLRFERDGSHSELWHGEGIPAIAWSRGRLLVAHKHGETLLEVPR
jgi:hypothetical protein